MSISSISSNNEMWSELLNSQINSGGKSAKAESSSSTAATSTESTSTDQVSDFINQVFTNMDTDGDGQISSEELSKTLEDSQGLLAALNEVTSQMAAFQAQNQEVPDFASMASDIISEKDTDGDSAVSLAESGLTESMFSNIDTDSDGSLTSDEIASGMENMPPPPPQEASSSSSESSSSSSIFDEFDTDGDGQVSAAELQIGMEKLRSSMMGLLNDSDSDSDSSSSSNILSQLDSESWNYYYAASQNDAISNIA
ncbi:MAG: hypothetical protein A2017_14690 [Lentisphaerae bacterium GWF2_44_16]|nr:MAG: hypothetical protein A2017_14690 [Lentisphaerae bacterium GWF2_44_16]